MIKFNSFFGTLTRIDKFKTGSEQEAECYKLMTVQNNEGSIVNFVIEPSTYFLDHNIMNVGDNVVGFYDANAPVPYIFPPQLRAIVMSKILQSQNVKVDHFNEELVSSDGLLKINMAPYIPMFLENGQPFTGNPGNHNLVVVYGVTTKSIPALTNPYKIIVLC